MTRKRISRKARKASLDDVVSELRHISHSIAVLIAQVARVRSNGMNVLIEALVPLGLRTRDVAKALGTTEATVNTVKGRARRGSIKAAEADAVAAPDESNVSET